MIDYPIPLLGFAAYSGTGKTTLLRKIIPLLAAKGIRIGMVKHTHHNIDVDQPGKDSYELRKSGTAQMVLASPKRTTLIVEHAEQIDSDLTSALGLLQTDSLDLVLVEGFKHEDIPKIELHRKEMERPFIYPKDPNIIAIVVAEDLELKNAEHLVRLNFNEPEGLADFIETQILKKQYEH